MRIVTPFYSGLSGILTVFSNVYKNSYFDYIKAYPSSTNPIEGRPNADDLIKRNYQESKDHWCSLPINFSYVVFHFPHHSVKLSDYTMMSRSDAINPYPKSWKVEASNYNDTDAGWKLIHETEPNDDMNGTALIHTYSITNNNEEYFKYFKITQTSNSLNNNFFCFAKIELFGDVLGRVGFTCNQRGYQIRVLPLAYLLFILN